MDNFNITELELTNFRKYDHAHFNLNPQMNVFVGKNGSGKTSVLEAIAVMLGAYLAAFKKYVKACSKSPYLP